MWPWDHLAVAYICFAAAAAATGTQVTDGRALAVAAASQFPDLVDKPLAWGLGALPSGVSAAHSVLIAVPATALLAVRRPRLALAVGAGWWSHILADFLFPLALDRPLVPEAYLWPVRAVGGYEKAGLLSTAAALFDRFLAVLATPRGLVYLGLEAVLLGAALGLWLRHGRPGIAPVRRAVGGSARSL